MVQQKEREKGTTEEISSIAARSDSQNDKQSGGTKKLKGKATIFASIIAMLPVLAVGGTAYHIANQTLAEEIELARQVGESVESKQAERERLLGILALGTIATALLAGGVVGFWTSRSLYLASIAAKKANRFSGETAQEERTQILTQTIQNIRNSLVEKDILEATVEEVRRILNCDRVLVYSREPESRGVVIAESVDPRWPRAIGRTITDPCFDARYDEKYQNGRVRAIENIREAGLSNCYVEQLKKLAVKANLVAPILNEGKLLGLLVAHQCEEPRIWQQWEVDLAAQIAVQVGFAVDNARVLAKSAQMEQQLKNEAQWTQFFTDAIQHIRGSLKEEDVFKAVVREVRGVLNCDRVVVYGLEEKNKGVVIAESVAPRWTRALGRTITDPCFDASYSEKYQKGRVRAIENIREANMTECYIEQLEKIEVIANLVAPILNEGKLLGLLVAHQCESPRKWQELEIRWFAQIAAQVGFAVDNARLLASSANIEQKVKTEAEWTQFFTDAIQHIRASLKEEDILSTAVEEVQRIIGCDRVVVYGLEAANKGVVIAESVDPRWPRILGRTITDPCFDASYSEKYQNGRVRAIENIKKAKMTPCYVQQLEKIEVIANLVAPILNEGKLLGLLVAHQCSEPRKWQELEIRWFAQIAAQVGFAVDNARVTAKSAIVKQQAKTEAEWTQFFTEAIGHIRTSLKEKDILSTAVEEVQKIIGCDRVVVYGLEAANKGVVIAESVDPRWPKILGKTIEDPCFDATYNEQYKNGRVKAIENIKAANMSECYVEQLEKIAVKANLVAPILNEGKLLGLLVAHQCSDTRVWQELEIRWFAQIAAQIGFAVDNARVLASSAKIQQQVKTEAEWTQFFSNTIAHIRASLKEEDILSTAVEEVQKIIDCDRVIVYGLEAINHSLVIAESVDPRWPRILGTTVEDPCFDVSYSVEDPNTRIKAIDNIKASNLSDYYIEQLEKIGVKANLVAPIFNEEKLFGLLVAHQCSQPRQWQELEIRWFAQIAVQIGFAVDNARLLASFANIEKKAEAISQEATVMTRESHLLAGELPELFADSSNAVASLIANLQDRKDLTIAVSTEIQELVNSTREIAASLETIEIQGTIDSENLAIFDRSIENMTACKTSIKQTAERVKNLKHFLNQVGEVEILINDLTARLNEQTINLIVEVGRGEEADRDTIISIADLIYSSIQQLATITGDIKPLIGEVITQTNEITATSDTLNKQAANTSESLQQTRSQFAEIASLKHKTRDSIDKIAKVAIQGAQNSNSIDRNLLELTNAAKATCEKSVVLTDYLDKLETVARRGIEVDLVEPS